MNLTVIVPNLDRRPDRWEACYDELKRAGFAPTEIERWSAIDGSQWDNTTDALIDRWKHYKGNVPPFLYKENWLVGNYGWSCTWYSIPDHIAGLPESELRLIIQDDFVLHEGKDAAFLKSTLEVLLEDKHDFRFVQLFPRALSSIWGQETGKARTIPYPQLHPKLPEIYCGTSGAGDAAWICSALGAQAIMDCANEFPNKATEVVFDYFSETREQHGCYSTTHGWVHNLTDANGQRFANDRDPQYVF